MVSYVEVPAGLEAAYERTLQPGDRFAFSRVRVKQLFLSRSRVKGISVASQLVALAPIWAAMSSAEKASWDAAGSASGLHGWKMFVADTTARRRAGVSGFATPQTLYQSMVGRIEVVAPATGLKIEQAHPSTYYVLKKVTGTKAQYSPKAISEPFSLPLTISISHKTALSAAGAIPRARFFCVVTSSYQGKDIETELSLDFGLADGWGRSSATLSTVVGLPRYYEAFIEVYNARGDLYFDNVEISHDGENWARDPVCNNIAQTFTRAFYQVEKHWVAVNPSDGSDFGSVYFVP